MVKTEMPKISIIIPVYNVEDYLSRCIDSILAQTFTDFELIIVDDGSTDGSAKICDEYAAKDKRIIVIHKENGGVSSARNVALESSVGELIAFIDADDWIHGRYLEYLYRALGESELSICQFEKTYQYGPDREIQFPEIKIVSGRAAASDNDLSSLCTRRLLRRSLIGNHRFLENIKMSEDYLFNMVIMMDADKVSVIDEKMYYYFQRETSASHTPGIGDDNYPSGVELLALAASTGEMIYLNRAYSSFFSARYMNMFRPDRGEYIKKCNDKLKECRKLSGKLMTFKQRVPRNIFIYVPALYRLMRILDDRSLLEWERKEKEKYR